MKGFVQRFPVAAGAEGDPVNPYDNLNRASNRIAAFILSVRSQGFPGRAGNDLERMLSEIEAMSEGETQRQLAGKSARGEKL